MTSYFLRTVGGNWSAAATWSLTSGGGATGAVPTAADDVICDAGSSTASLAVNGTSGSPSLCRSITCTGFTGTMTMGSTAYLKIGTTTANASNVAALFVSGMTFSPNSNAIIEFSSTQGTSGTPLTIASGTKRVCNYLFTGTGYTQYSDAQNFVANSTVTLTSGSLNMGAFNVANTSGANFSSSNTNTRALIMPSSCNFNLTNTAGTQWDVGTQTNLTMTLNSGSTISSNSTTQAGTMNVGTGFTYGTLTHNTITSGNLTLNGAATWNNMTLSVAGSTLIKTTQTGFTLNGNHTVTGTFTASSAQPYTRNFIDSNISGTARTITAATVTVNGTDFRDITGAGAGSWNLSAASNGSGDCGGNSGITFTTPRNVYLKTGASANYSATTIWFTTSGGSTAITAPTVPLPQDQIFIDGNSITAGSVTLTVDMPRIAGINMTGVTNSPTVAFATTGGAYEIHGGLIYPSSGVTITSASAPTFRGRGTYSISWGQSYPNIVIAVDGPNGTFQLTGNSSMSNILNFYNGTFDMNGKNFTTSQLNIGSATNTTVGATAKFNGALTTAAGSFGINILGATATFSKNFVWTGTAGDILKIDNTSTVTFLGMPIINSTNMTISPKVPNSYAVVH